jgi:hypothetical protein
MVSLPFIGNIDISSMIYSYAEVAALFLGALLFIFCFAMLVYKVKKGEWFGKYPVKVRIWERRAGHFLLAQFDNGRSRNDAGGAWYYELKKSKVKTQPYEFDYINPDNSLDLIRLNRDEYHPMKIVSDISIIKKTDGSERAVSTMKLQPVIDETFKHVYIARIKKNFERRPYDDFFTKYGGVITILVTGIMVFLILALVLREMAPIVDSAAGAATALADAAKTCRVVMPPAP